VTIDISKNDLLTLRSEVYAQLCDLRRTPAWKSKEGRGAVVPQATVLAKLIRKLNRACKQAFGHDCHAKNYNLSLD
jgi:hypothetical protein